MLRSACARATDKYRGKPLPRSRLGPISRKVGALHDALEGLQILAPMQVGWNFLQFQLTVLVEQQRLGRIALQRN
jgi:hypothetical protein